MELTTREYRNYFRLGEMGTLKISTDKGGFYDFPVINVQMHDASVEVVLVSDELPAEMQGKEIAATLSVITGHLICDAPVIIGRNSFEQTLFLRFNGEALVRIKRNYIRTDVLIPFIYTEHGKNTAKAIREVQSCRDTAAYMSFTPIPYGESFKVANWHDIPELLPTRVNLGGGGVRFASVEPFQRDGALAYRCFLTGLSPK